MILRRYARYCKKQDTTQTPRSPPPTKERFFGCFRVVSPVSGISPPTERSKVVGVDGRDLTFGQMFDEAWGDEEVTGKPGYMYVFLVSHPENRLVCQIPEPCLRLVSVFAPSGKDMVELPFDEWISPNSRVQIQTPLAIDSSDALLEQYADLDHMACTGLLVTIPGEVVKVLQANPAGIHSSARTSR